MTSVFRAAASLGWMTYVSFEVAGPEIPVTDERPEGSDLPPRPVKLNFEEQPFSNRFGPTREDATTGTSQGIPATFPLELFSNL
jgi:hypothetical protein